ncbi:hypothetical protein M911_12165 [Ectothiorhodospira haloalkaliphila]|uniref:Class I SAM-dependent methyltransferase n=1 Tax=Ectothiorhodospira haloalkaliphila TaxID=421628 RepID=W8KRZ8_9GAMM|nr:class I SAM-dependent methyltransferase [Ectothiorhodospira haloalkaliphila]AHK79782.1 hypothetical protein M911_12165 [Ectothiorhodospira haloalkaliphila]
MALILLIMLALVLGIAVGQVLLLHKVTRIHLATFQLMSAGHEVKGLFHQLQAYNDLNSLIRPQSPLPLLRGWASSPDFLLHLTQDALRSKPSIILECSSGASTTVLARCCQLNGAGHVFSLEHDARYAEETREQLEDQGLESWATVIHSPLVENVVAGQPWYDLSDLATSVELSSADMLVVDGPPATTAQEARYPALPELDKYLKQGGRVYLDDASRKDELRIIERWLEEYPGYTKNVLRAEKGAVKLVKQLDP